MRIWFARNVLRSIAGPIVEILDFRSSDSLERLENSLEDNKS